MFNGIPIGPNRPRYPNAGPPVYNNLGLNPDPRLVYPSFNGPSVRMTEGPGSRPMTEDEAWAARGREQQTARERAAYYLAANREENYSPSYRAETERKTGPKH